MFDQILKSVFHLEGKINLESTRKFEKKICMDSKLLTVLKPVSTLSDENYEIIVEGITPFTIVIPKKFYLKDLMKQFKVFSLDSLGIILVSEDLKIFFNLKENISYLQVKQGELVQTKLDNYKRIEVILTRNYWEVVAVI